MSSHVYSDIYLHASWHCYCDRPLLTPEVADALHAFLREYCTKEKGVHFLVSGGTATHVHLAFQIEPFVVISTLLGKIKGASAHQMNVIFGKDTLQWQRGYGVVSFSKRQLAYIRNYVENQKEHHAKGTLVRGLESPAGEGGEV